MTAMSFSAVIWVFQWTVMDVARTLGTPAAELDSYIWRLAWVIAGIVVGLFVWFATEPLHRGAFWKLTGAIVGLFLVLGTIASVSLQLAFFNITEMWPEGGGTVARIYGTTRFWLHFYLAWAMVLLALIYSVRVASEQSRRLAAQSAVQQSEFEVFRYQLDPDFLSSTFRSVQKQIATAQLREAAATIGILSDCLRQSLAPDATEDVPLAQEIRREREFLQLEKVRLAERLLVSTIVAEECDTSRTLVPGFILRPLVENAIRCGSTIAGKTLQIAVSVAIESDRIHLCVASNAMGDGENAPSFSATGENALEYVKSRLASRFGDEAALYIEQNEQGAYQTRIDMPLVELPSQ